LDEPLKAIDQVSTGAIDLAMRFGPRVLVAIPQREVRMLAA
jgi:hypothetical protein